MNIALIPVRQGSKTLENKNILPLGGKPLFVHSIEAALTSKLFQRVIVSTDAEEYAEIARHYGAEVPFLRSPELARDSTPTSDVTLDVLTRLRRAGEYYEYFAVLQASSPLRTAEDIQKSFLLLKEKNAKNVISICPSPVPRIWINTVPASLSLENFIDAPYRNKARQLLPKYYIINGALFWGKTDHYYHNTNVFQKGTYGYVMPPERSIDIDTEIDYELARILFKKNIQ